MMLKDQALKELNGFNSEDFARNSESSFDGEMRGKELDTAKTDSLSRCVARRVGEVRMTVTRKVFWVWVWDQVQTEKPIFSCSSLSLLTLMLGLKRLKFLLMAIKRISG